MNKVYAYSPRKRMQELTMNLLKEERTDFYLQLGK